MVNISKQPNSKFRVIYIEGQVGELETTAWFIEQCNRWFDYMSSRHPVMDLSKNNLPAYESAVKFLRNFVSLVENMEVGEGDWKHVQAGIILCTM